MAEREKWIDWVKAFACILVVLGHFFQSMVMANILPDNMLYHIENDTLYLFHVPLFFICSGYLYQRRSRVDSLRSWMANIGRKALNLGVPYFVFSIATWLLKKIFSGAVNTEAQGLVDTLFLHPSSPYWFLYALFFIFLITPTFGSAQMTGIGLGAAVAMKALALAGVKTGIQPLDYLLGNEIWFVLGMLLSRLNWKEKAGGVKGVCWAALGLAFLVSSVVLHGENGVSPWIGFVLGLAACFAVMGCVICLEKTGRKLPLLDALVPYTFPVFVMHTLSAAPVRALLQKVGVSSPLLHIPIGLAASFAVPIILAILMKKLVWPEFILYPGKFLKGNRRHENPVHQ